MKRKRDDLFRFVINRDVESTNNRAERAIRPIVTYRKVSVGSRSDVDARDFARVYSVLETKRKNGKFPFRANPG
ncbi:MAG: transposase [Thermoplasmatales archaeon]